MLGGSTSLVQHQGKQGSAAALVQLPGQCHTAVAAGPDKLCTAGMQWPSGLLLALETVWCRAHTCTAPPCTHTLQ